MSTDTIETVTETPQFVYMDLASLRESPDNPRKHFQPHALAELVASIRTHGVLTPLTVREMPQQPHVIAAGHRRFRAAQEAGLNVVPCVLRAMSDTEFLEILTIDNLQRDDLHPLEEAQGFRLLMERAGYDIAGLGARIGRSTRYVYDRLRFLTLTPEAQKIFQDNQITPGHAVLLARLKPEDQARAMASDRSGNGRIGGLFVREFPLLSQAAEDSVEDGAREEPRKPVSVGEFAKWIQDYVRFDPTQDIVQDLFANTAAAIASAEADDLKVVKITREYRVQDDAKDPDERTYGVGTWKRADGKPEYNRNSGKKVIGKECAHQVLGLLVAGDGRGESFKVCIAKQKCRVHWLDDVRAFEARRKEKAAAADTPTAKKPAAAKAPAETSWQREEKMRQATENRWKKAGPALLEAVARQLRIAETSVGSPAAKRLLEACTDMGSRTMAKKLKFGTNADDLVRAAVFILLAGDIENTYSAEQRLPAALKPFGVDARKILNEAAPLPKAEEKKPAKKKLAGDVRRAEAKKKAKTARRDDFDSDDGATQSFDEDDDAE